MLAGIEDIKTSYALRTEGLIGGLANSGFLSIQGNNNPQSIIFLELNDLFPRTVLGSQENSVGSTEISHLTPRPHT